MSQAAISPDVLSRLHELMISRIPAYKAQGARTNESLLATGVLDSVGVMLVARYVEEEFSVELSDEELNEETFDSVESLARLITNKLP